MEAKKIKEKENSPQNIQSSEAMARKCKIDLYPAKHKFVPWNEPNIVKCQREPKRQRLIAPEE